MRPKLITAVLVTSLAVTLTLLLSPVQHLTPAPALADVTASGQELSMYMSQMQRLTHKLGLAIDAGNKDLATFYLGEMGETADVMERTFPEYDNFQIGALIKAMLRPSLAPAAVAIEGGDMAAASTAYEGVITACNSCHIATQRTFVKIIRVKTNPFSQSFK